MGVEGRRVHMKTASTFPVIALGNFAIAWSEGQGTQRDPTFLETQWAKNDDILRAEQIMRDRTLDSDKNSALFALGVFINPFLRVDSDAGLRHLCWASGKMDIE